MNPLDGFFAGILLAFLVIGWACMPSILAPLVRKVTVIPLARRPPNVESDA